LTLAFSVNARKRATSRNTHHASRFLESLLSSEKNDDACHQRRRASPKPMRSYLSDKKVLVLSVFAAGLCSLVYELLVSTTAAYFLGDSVRQFSITIGLYLAAMGLGSYLSRLVRTDLLRAFIAVEGLLGVVGGLSVPLLYLVYSATDLFWPAVALLILAIGALTGLEIPLLTRILERGEIGDGLDVNLSNVLAFDYLGALMATLAFPFVLLPLLGTFRAALVLGLVNLGVGALCLWWFRDALRAPVRRRGYAFVGAAAVGLGLLLGAAGTLTSSWSDSIYEDRVVYREQSRYQRIVMTRYRSDLRLFLNGNLQFSSRDEHRYHEALVHVPLRQVERPRRVLILGGGDGLAAREVLKHEAVEHVTVADLDPAVFELGRTHPTLTRLNARSLHSPRVETVARDAFVFLENAKPRYDVILADLPDPNDVSLARLYSRSFYRLVRSALASDGVFVTQATSPYFAKKAFWTIRQTVASAGFAHVYPYHASVPSFGEWGFVMASLRRPLRPTASADAPLEVSTRFLTADLLPSLFAFPKDLAAPAERLTPSTLDRPRVLNRYLDGWRHWG
jgi:spermidine synthase